MELWIRSQKSEELRPILLKVNEFEIGDYDGDMNCIVVNNLHCVGIYKTKERALEVLDEIQRILHPTVFMSGEINTDDNNWIKNGIIYQKCTDNFSIQKLSTYVYEMPEE